MSENHSTSKPALNRYGKARFLQLLVFVLAQGALLFISAGRFDWPGGWAYLGLYAACVTGLGIYMVPRNPEVINERGRMGQNTKGWDRVLVTFFSIVSLSILVIAGLEYRWAGATVPAGLQIFGGVTFLISFGITGWAMAANTYLATTVRIQEERGHQVVTGGPYRFVRHPMYAGSFFFTPGTPLLLGSWWALIPAVLVSVLVIVRTALEDKTLQAELPGYKVYAQRTKYRIFPGVW
jgi:protein-S-isoprenylcysteine O-methyltransferase Ste14